MHLPVLLQEVVAGLAPQAGEVILDATVGGGGHSEALCRAVGGDARFVCLDADDDALGRSKQRLARCGCEFLFYRTNFRNLETALDSFGIGEVNRALFDLGMSSEQLEESGRGFSFQRDEPLLMTFQKIPPRLTFQKKLGGYSLHQGRIQERELTAARILNEWDAENIETILESYGEEKAAKRIAQRIVAARAKSRFGLRASLRSL